MPHIVEFLTPAFSHYRPVRVDLDYLKINYNNNRIRADGLRDAIELSHLEKADSAETLPINDYTLNRMANRVFDAAISSSSLAIVECGGPVGAPDVSLSSLIENGIVPAQYVFADPIAALKTIRSFCETLREPPNPESVRAVVLEKSVNRILSIMSASRTDGNPIPHNATFEYANDKKGSEDYIFIPGYYPGYEGDDMDVPSFALCREAMSTSAKTNPSGLDALKGPVFAYGSSRNNFEIDIDDIESMVCSDFLNDPDAVIERRTDGLGWDEMWDDRATCRASDILDSVETETLKTRLRPVLDQIIETICQSKENLDDEAIGQAVEDQFAKNRQVIQDILNQWNSEQTAHDFSLNDRTIVTFAPGLTRQGIIDALIASAHTGLETIATLRQTTDGPEILPWESQAAQNLERAHIIMMEPPVQPKPVILQPSPNNDPASAPSMTP